MPRSAPTATAEAAAGPVAPAIARIDAYGLAVTAPTLAVSAFLAARLTAWPPHEDETLALFVGHGSLGSLVDTVLGERGGAPLHFLLAWIVEHLGGGLTGLRFLSAIFAVASIPLVAELGRRLGGRATGAIAAVLVASSWVLLFHAVYARMYSLFLFTSLVSYLALLWALRRGGAARWCAWGAAILLVVATHPYGALVLASQGLFVLLAQERIREAIAAFAAVGVLGIPFWITDLVLAGRFDVGVGPGGSRLGRPDRVLAYFGQVAADFTAGPIVLPVVLAAAALGLRLLWLDHRREALLVVSVLAVPLAAFMVARLGASAAPETRHLIFALPFFVVPAAAAIARRPMPAAVAATLILAAGGVAWTWEKTPALFTGEPVERETGREAAADWLAETGRPNDVLLGYDPVFLGPWRRSETFSRLVLPRADSRLAARTLAEAPAPLGRGVWVFVAHGPTSAEQRLAVPVLRPRPPAAFETRAFGPYLVLRTREPTGTPERYLAFAASAMLVGKTLGIADADINFATISRTAALLD